MESFESYLHRLNKQHLRARPSRWLEIQNVDGDILYLDKYTNDVTLTDPRNPLPDGWEEGIDGGKRYFIDHNTNLKTYNDPREKNVPQRALNDLLDDIIDDIYKKQSKTLVEEIIDEARNGKMYILVDDPDRENEGDLIIPAEKATPDAINFMAKHGRGLICLSMTKQRIE